MSTIKAVAFDMGGVIELNDGRNILEEIAEMVGAPIVDFKKAYWERNHLSNVENMSWENMIMEVVRVFNKTSEAEKRVREFVRRYNNEKIINRELVTWFPALRRIGLKVAILSNATSELRGKLEQLGIAPLVDEIVVSGEIGYQKPHKEAFDVLFQRLGLRSDEVVFIDDSAKSLEKANEIGYIPIQFKDNEQLRADLAEIGVELPRMDYYKGAIVKESLIHPDILKSLFVIKADVTEDDDPWHLYTVAVNDGDFDRIQKEIKDNRWYIHFWKWNEMMVLFKDKRFRIDFSRNMAGQQEAIDYGISIGIPEEQRDFLIDHSI